MFLLKQIYGKVWSDTNSTELAQISTGQLFLVRPGSIQGSRECLFNNAIATIRRSTQEYNFQLVVTRVFEEGEEQLLDEDEETEDERYFLIDEQLHFRVGEFESEPAFRWRDMQGDVNDLYEFVAVGTNQPTSTFFETCMYKAMWERKYSRSAEEASDKDLKQFVYSIGRPVGPKAEQHQPSISQSIAASPKPTSSKSIPKKRTPKYEQRSQKIQGLENTILTEQAEVYCWDEEKAMFEWEGQCEANILESNPFEYKLVICQGGSIFLLHLITSDFNGQFKSEFYSFTWNHIQEGHQSSWCLRFPNIQAFENCKSSYAKALYESLNRSAWNKMKDVERQYVIQSHEEDVIMKDVEGMEEEAVQAELLARSESESDDEEQASSTKSSRLHENSSDNDAVNLPKGENEMLAVGFNKDRSYVVRSGQIGVFKSNSDGAMEHHGTLSSITNSKGQNFTPKQMMLHDQDNAMILMDPRERNSVFKMDIERGKIVEEWKVDDNVPILHMAPESKFAQTQPEQTILGASGNALFRLDPRLSGNKLVNSEFKQYAAQNKFSGMTTTEGGQVAVASEKGDIRLFDKIGKNAKTALPAMGDPIIGIDVTKDGRWIVATCRSYLLVVDTKIPEGRYAGQLGFDRSFPADAKPAPKRLRLQNAHVQYMGGSITFSPARFNIGEGQEETSIVTSSGNFVIAWDFRAIKRGKYDKYEIRRYKDVVVQDQFKYGDQNDIVVALRNNVLVINKNQLKDPTRTKSYGGSIKRSSSRIVKTRF